MEPRQEEKQGQEPRPEAKEAKPRRFRIIKLEERIAPGNQPRTYGGAKCYTLAHGNPCHW
jgi:hypothetical protein